MYSDLNGIKEYPYEGEFYTIVETESDDGDLLSDENNAEEMTILTTVCDIQESSKKYSSGSLIADYNVYLPSQENGKVALRRGLLFRGDVHGMPVEGTVVGLIPGELGVKVMIKMVAA